jgi:hypothetical protein
MTDTTLKCDVCNIQLKSKRNLIRHGASSTHLKRVEKAKSAFQCNCGKWYSYRQSLYLHRKQCKLEDTPEIKRIDDFKTAYEDEKAAREALEKEIETLKKSKCITNNSTQIENQTNIENQTVNIHINAFGKENLDHITDKFIIKCIASVYKSIPNLIKKIHFDPDHPENKNIQITNKKMPHASIMTKDKTWKTMDREKAIEQMIDRGYCILDENYPILKDNVSESQNKHFQRFQNDYENQQKKLMTDIKKDIDIMVLNSTRGDN